MKKVLDKNISSPGRREQKKASIRRDIVKAAHALFGSKGFDNVTVAEVAQAADISVKTLFQYFRTKEDIVFDNEMELAEELIASISRRKKGQSILIAATAAIIGMIKKEKSDALTQIEKFSRMLDNPVLKSRLQMMWLHYEEAFAMAFSQELSAKSSDVRPKLVAIQIVALLRILTSTEAHRHLSSGDSSKKSLIQWFQNAANFVGRDLSSFGK